MAQEDEKGANAKGELSDLNVNISFSVFAGDFKRECWLGAKTGRLPKKLLVPGKSRTILLLTTYFKVERGPLYCGTHTPAQGPPGSREHLGESHGPLPLARNC